MSLSDLYRNVRKKEPSQLKRVWVRFSVIGFFLIAAFVFSPLLNVKFIVPALLSLCSMGFAANLILLLWILWGRGLRNSMYYATFVDVFLITVAVHYLGGIESTFSWVYVVALIAVALLHGVRMGIYLAVVSSLLYTGLLYGEFLRYIPHVDFNRIYPTFLYEDPNYLHIKLLSNYILFFVTAGVSGFLSQRLRLSRDRLETTVIERTRKLKLTNEQLQEEIAERWRAEEALRESEEKFRSLVELTSDWIWETDQYGTYIYASPQVKEILGYDPEEIIGKNAVDIIPQEEADKSAAFFVEKTLRKEPFIGYVNTNVRKDGKRIVVETSGIPILDDSGNVLGYRGVDRDVTEAERAERELKDSEQRLKILFEYAPDAYYLNDFEGRFVDGNMAAEKLIGYSRAELIGKSFLDLDLLSPDQLEIAARNLAENARGIPTGPVELVLNRKDGTHVTVEVTTFPVTIKGEFLALGIARDVTERKRAERMLRFTQFSIDRSADAAFWMEPDGRFIYVNEAACRSLGYSRDELLTMSVQDIDPDFPAEIWPDHWKELKERGSFTYESRHRSKDGRVFPTEITANFMEFEGKEYNCAFVHDISQRKESERVLEGSLSLLRSTLESTADGILVVDTTGRIQSFNHKFLEIWRFPEHVVASSDDFEMRMYILRHLEDPADMFEKVERLYDHPEQEMFSVIGLKDGRILEWYAKPQVIGGKTIGMVENFRDVTERRRAEQLLRDSEEKYRMLFEESKDGIFISTPDGKFLDINPAGVEMYGYSSKEELLNVDIARDLYVDPDKREVIKKELSEKGYVKDYEIIYRRKDGKVITVLETVTAMRDDAGNIIAYRGIQRDVTEQKKLEQQFLQAQKMESLGTLAGGIAHDFNNILSGILGYASFMKSKIDTDHPHYRYLDTIEKSSKRAAELTSQLLGFARGGRYNVRPLNVNTIVSEVLEIVRNTFTKNITIESNLSEPLPAVAADANQLQQVIMNLCVNSSDAMPGGGSLAIATGVETLTEEYVETHTWAKTGTYVFLAVTDTGIGMDDETAKRVFEPFFTTKEEGKGTGLGLSMVYGVIKNHGGYIDVISAPNQGATFKIFLPMCGETEEYDSPEADAPGDSAKESILVVDDEEPVRLLTKDVLETHGYRVLLAVDGVEAIDVFKKYDGDVSLAIIDMTMPRMDGRETFLKLRQHNPDIKALLSTGYDQNDKTKEILSIGFVGFLQKPYLPDTLLSIVRAAVDSN